MKSNQLKVLLAGESWIITTTEVKGVDEFSISSYEESGKEFKTALEEGGFYVSHMPAHRVPTDFPDTKERLDQYDLIVLSDIGANSLQLAPSVFQKSIPGNDRIAELVKWVRSGGSLLMIGGYLSFTGFEAKAAYGQTELVDILPVDLLPCDDRVEKPSGVEPKVLLPEHPALGGCGEKWPHLLGYNRVLAKSSARVLATVADDPLIAITKVDHGRTAVFTSDCAPHWAPPEFSRYWDGYNKLFVGLAKWLTDSL